MVAVVNRLTCKGINCEGVLGIFVRKIEKKEVIVTRSNYNLTDVKKILYIAWKQKKPSNFENSFMKMCKKKYDQQSLKNDVSDYCSQLVIFTKKLMPPVTNNDL